MMIDAEMDGLSGLIAALSGTLLNGDRPLYVVVGWEQSSIV